MAQNLSDVKNLISCTITISKTQLTIRELLNQYHMYEGEHLPYRRLGFNSAIELLQNMPDILKLPPDPNESSKITPNVSDKSSHLRELVMKQRSSSKTRKNKAHSNRQSNVNGRNMNNQRNTDYIKRPNSSNNFVNNNNVNNFQNRGNNVKSNIHSSNYNRKSWPTSSVCGSIDNKSSNQNGVHNSGHVTDALRAYIEFIISKKSQKISKEDLEDLIKNHKDFPALKSNNMNDIINKISSFLIINDNEVLLKGKNQIESDEDSGLVPAIYSDTAFYNQTRQDKAFISRQSSKESDSNHSQHDISHHSSTTNNSCNNFNKTWNGFDKFGPDQFNNTNESDFLTNSKFNEEEHNDIVINDNLKPIRHKTRHIPDNVLFYMAKLFQNVFSVGVHIENFKYVYKVVYHTTLDSTVYGFSSDLQMFKRLNGNMIRIRNEVLFINKSFDFKTFYKSIQFDDNDQAKQNLIGRIVNSIPDISLNINIKTPFFSREIEHEMIMIEAHSPSLFFLQYEMHLKKYADLMNNMRVFYEQENTKFCVQPDQIIPGLIFVSSYKTYLNIKQWRRIRILKEVDQMSVEVFHIDYGHVQILPKTEIRFLKNEFATLPCQAIHCCLDGYNALNVIPRAVTNAFFEMTVNKKLRVCIHKVNSVNYENFEYKILYVTLLKTNPNSNINDELTYGYLAEHKAAERYFAHKCKEEIGVSGSNS